MSAAKWSARKLGELFQVKHGYAFKGECFADSGEHILLTPGNFREEGGLKLKGDREKYYTGDFPQEFLLREGDLLIAMTDLTQNAPILGSPAFVPEDGRFLHNQRLGKVYDLRSELIFPDFLFYLLNTASVRGQIKGSATGATVRHTSPSRIYDVVVEIPPLATQRRIASILSAYDDLIENSQRRIKILESMARALYREWFVHFRFPGHENHPRVASPLGEIPEGWEVRRIDEALRFDSGRTIKKEERENGNTPVYGANGIIGGTANAAMADKGIIMGKIGSCGALHRSHVPCWVTNNAFLVQPAAIQSWELAWQALLDIDFRQYVGGAANPYMPINTFGQHEVLVPTAGVQAEFQKRAAPLRILVETLSERIDNLRRTRDLLLPRLLSGQIALDELEAA